MGKKVHEVERGTSERPAEGVMCWCSVDHDSHCVAKRLRSEAPSNLSQSAHTDVELDSPRFRPLSLMELEARGFKRHGRRNV